VSYHPDAHQTKASFVRTTWIPVRTFLCVEKLQTAPSCIHLDDTVSRPNDPQCSTKASRFLSKTQIWEDRCNRPDDVDSRPVELIHKASIAIQIQTSGRQSSWSGRACIKYGIACIRSTVRTTILLVRTREASIWKLLAANVQPSGCQGNTVRMRLSNRKDFQTKFLEFRSHSCLSGRPMTTVRTVPNFIKPDAHLNCQPINRGP
jgi:hypothetical protein